MFHGDVKNYRTVKGFRLFLSWEWSMKCMNWLFWCDASLWHKSKFMNNQSAWFYNEIGK